MLIMTFLGLAGGRYTYRFVQFIMSCREKHSRQMDLFSDYCGRLAAQGMVVLALEHRDGSGPMVMPKDEETGEPTPKLYLEAKELEYVSSIWLCGIQRVSWFVCL